MAGSGCDAEHCLLGFIKSLPAHAEQQHAVCTCLTLPLPPCLLPPCCCRSVMPSTWCGRELGRKKGHYNEHGLLLYVRRALGLPLLLLMLLGVARAVWAWWCGSSDRQAAAGIACHGRRPC